MKTPWEARWWQRCHCCRRRAQWRSPGSRVAWCMPCKFGGDPDDTRCSCNEFARSA